MTHYSLPSLPLQFQLVKFCIWAEFLDTKLSEKSNFETPEGVQIKTRVPSKICNKNALTAAFSLACLEIRSRNKEAINSTRNRIYSLRAFYFLLYRR